MTRERSGPLPEQGARAAVTERTAPNVAPGHDNGARVDVRPLLARSQAVIAEHSRDPDVQAFLAAPEPEYDWLVEGLLERGDRVILTAPEGAGKSTLMRQLGVQIAAGISPFTLVEIEPRAVLLVDAENGRRHVARALRPLIAAAGARLGRRRLIPHIRPEGFDLLDADDARTFSELVRRNTPDVVLLGPIYRLISGNPSDEEPARAVTALLDSLRAELGFALLLEAHTPHATAGGARPMRPFGASLWRRWPEFGLWLSPEGKLRHWRGARDERAWPAALRRGGAWPWTISEADDLEQQIAEVLRVHRAGGGRMTTRAAEDAVRASGIRARAAVVRDVLADVLEGRET